MRFEEHYVNSWALVVGINDYQFAPPLTYACNDAEGVKKALIEKLNFNEDKICLLLNEQATRVSIMERFLALAKRAEPNDRILFFFAGHGHTEQGNRGETGFLFPVDGTAENLATLIRWDDLTRNADLISAKHMLFIMDACYGGLAVARYVPPGSMRFLKDMLARYSRQVLTAGKADEVVADSGGPREGHSIFTGHLLEAFDGAASNQAGVLTAGGVMAYVYDRVANDQNSQQTPHYGSLDGDGDLVFLPEMRKPQQGETKSDNVLVEIPPTLATPDQGGQADSLETLVKQYLSDSRQRIALDDLVMVETKKALYKLDRPEMSMRSTQLNSDRFVERLQHYESCMFNLRLIIALICRWGREDHKPMLERILARIGETHEMASGQVVWLGLRWYTINVLLYTGGIAALASSSYDNLHKMLTTKIQKPGNTNETIPLILPMVEGRLEVSRTEAWKLVPGHERNYVPESEYAFKETQQIVEDLFFLGKSYENLFDRFEMFMSLTYSHLNSNNSGAFSHWGPPGRFWWKYSGRGATTNPFSQLLLEAGSLKDRWKPLRAGFFGGSYANFEPLAVGYEKNLQGLRWY